MQLTAGVLTDFFEEYGCIPLKIPSDMGRKYKSIRVYYPGTSFDSRSLYLLDAAMYAQIDNKVEGALCLITMQETEVECCEFVIRTDKPVTAVFSHLQEKQEELVQWDRELSEILLRDGSLQELLNCSMPILKAPCFLQDSNFYLLASSGSVSEEENQFFYETLRTGRAPSGLFTQLLSMNPAERPYSSPKAISSAVKVLRNQRVLIADCCVDGVVVLHFCLYYGDKKRMGLSDMIIHLMQRIEAGPSIRLLSSKSTDLHDELFSKIIDAPDDGEFTSICSVLGLFRYQRFMVACIDLGIPSEAVDEKMTMLRALFPRFWFFRYRNQLFALMGVSQETPENDLALQKSLLQQLQAMRAVFGCSLNLFSLHSLKMACQQAAEALSFACDTSAAYEDILVDHMIDCFYAEHPFELYCPETFLQLLEDDKNTGSNNLVLLHTYLSNNCNATAVSRILHMHRNNVIYRIDKIGARYQFNLTDGNTRLLLQILAGKAMMDLKRNGEKK